MRLTFEQRLTEKANSLRTPLNLAFELTPVCNLRCDMCYIRTESIQTQAMGGIRSGEQWLEIGRQAQAMGTLYILLTGGEPLLHPDFATIYKELHDMGFLLRINTNGTLLNEQLCQLFATRKPRSLNVTLYGASAETYATLCHAPEGYRQCIGGLRLLKEHGVKANINYSVVRNNQNDVMQARQIAESMGMPFDAVSYMIPALRPHCPQGRDICAARLPAKESAQCDLWNQQQTATDTHEGEGTDCKKLSTPNARDSGGGLTLSCRAGRSAAWVNWQLIMTPCAHLSQPQADLACTSMADAWQRMTHAETQLPAHRECGPCGLRRFCPVCYAAALHEKRATGSLDYLCTIAREKKNAATLGHSPRT